MTSINISLKKEAYQFLKTLKTKEKSFSDIILDFKKKQDVMKFFGIFKHSNWTHKEKTMKELRESFNKRLP
tara:strand:+ start:9756 stop:9968 length:213 start_codon:yes stop_codon:yes gene_type:complete